ncbi:MAG: hypothetical protein KF861_18330 [Planctomycetaceae bacterium]|nr:hypothetical protein [Planctomycetaceae bacterium]
MCAAGIIATYAVEQLIVTDRERIEAALHEMAAAFERRDRDAVLSSISPQQDELRTMVSRAFETVTAVDHLHLTDVSVDVTSQGTRATSHFRANGRFQIALYGDIGHRATRWSFSWQREAGEWRIHRIQRLNPITGEAIDLFAVRE